DLRRRIVSRRSEEFALRLHLYACVFHAETHGREDAGAEVMRDEGNLQRLVFRLHARGCPSERRRQGKRHHSPFGDICHFRILRNARLPTATNPSIQKIWIGISPIFPSSAAKKLGFSRPEIGQGDSISAMPLRI